MMLDRSLALRKKKKKVLKKIKKEIKFIILDIPRRYLLCYAMQKTIQKYMEAKERLIFSGQAVFTLMYVTVITKETKGLESFKYAIRD